jgi:hypothetical protein
VLAGGGGVTVGGGGGVCAFETEANKKPAKIITTNKIVTWYLRFMG